MCLLIFFILLCVTLCPFSICNHLDGEKGAGYLALLIFFCGSFMFLFCLVFAMFCARLFICALWSPAGKGLISWLSFVVSTVSLSLSHWYPGSGVVLNCIDS